MTLSSSHQQLARLSGFISVALLSLTIGGCTTQPTPTPSSTATTHWKNGVSPTPNDLENTPYVKYLRDVAWAEAIAWNTGDFSIPEYTDHGWGMEARAAESDYEDQGDEAYVYLAPKPFVPIKISPLPRDNSKAELRPFVDVLVCVAPETAYKKMVDPKHDGVLYAKPYVVSHYMSELPDGQLTDMPAGTDETCDDVDVPVALFDNPPTLPELPVTEPERTAPPATK